MIANHRPVIAANASMVKIHLHVCVMLVTPDFYAKRKSTNANRTLVSLEDGARISLMDTSAFANLELLDLTAKLMSMSAIAIHAEMGLNVLMVSTGKLYILFFCKYVFFIMYLYFHA